VGVLILFFVLYTVWFLTGRPTISVDYLAIVNQMSRPQARDEDNAWPHYEKAISLYVEPDTELRKIVDRTSGRVNLEGLNEDEQEEIRKWVELNEAAWQEFVAGSLKSYCYRECSYNSKDEDKWLFNVKPCGLRIFAESYQLGIGAPLGQLNTKVLPGGRAETCSTCASTNTALA
jgi:hypothetical protein